MGAGAEIGELVSKYTSVEEELTSLLGFIGDTRDTLGGLHAELPAATDALASITKATEKATHNILELVEKVMEADDTVEEALRKVQQYLDTVENDEIKEAATTIIEAHENRSIVMTEMMSELSFQDLTCQTIQKITNTLAEIEFRIKQLLNPETAGELEDLDKKHAGSMSGIKRLEEQDKKAEKADDCGQDFIDALLNK